MVAFFELLLFLVAFGVIAIGKKNSGNGVSSNTVNTKTIRCPNCGSSADLQGGHWECPYCGDSGSR